MTRVALLVLHAFVAATALAGAIWVVPTMPLDWIKAGPFDDWTIPALALGFVGLLAATAFIVVLRRPRYGAAASIAVGAAMIAFEVVEIGVVGWTLTDPELEGYFQAWLQVVYLAVGSAQVLLGIGLWLARPGTRSSAAADTRASMYGHDVAIGAHTVEREPRRSESSRSETTVMVRGVRRGRT
jgi:hypothetical protein